MTFVSRVLGFIREMVAAHVFGASLGYDAFIVASKIPNFMRRLFAEGAFSQAFVPILSEYRVKCTEEEVQTFVNRVSGCFAVVLLVVTVIGILIAPLLVLLFAPGFATVENGSRYELATEMLRITFPYLMFISLTAFAGGILNSFGRFAIPAITPVFLNIVMIIASLWFTPFFKEPALALAWGIFLGGIVQLVFQWPFLKKLNLLPRPEINWKDKGVRRILLLMLPALLGVSVNQLNLMLTSVFASFLPVGSVSWLYYAERLMEFPLGGFAVALATVVLPRMARQHADARQEEFSITLDWGLRWVMLVGLPAALGLYFLAGPLLVTLFQSGKFTERDVLMSQPCLMAYAFGIMGFMGVKIFASAYYAKQNIKTPVHYAIVTVIANAVLSILFIQYFAQMGLALATSLAALLNASLLAIGLFRRGQFQLQPGWGALILQLALACIVMTAVISYFNPSIEEWFAFDVRTRILILAALIFGSIAAYITTLFASGLRVHHMLAKA